MYVLRFNGAKVKRQFIKLLPKYSEKIRERLKDTLENNPYPNPVYGSNRKSPSKVERKGSLFCYELSGGDRILYDIIEEPVQIVLIYFAGNHDGEIRFFKKFN
jgi:mRNA-degrading endonuclease RelE of RelBE toxin-antitoxin system